MRVLVTGAGGLLAAAIIREFGASRSDRPDRSEPRVHEVFAFEREKLDVADQASVDRLLAEIRPDVVINGAAYNHVDAAEDNAATALRVNALAVLAMAKAARSIDSVLVHYSSDFVFDGRASQPYREEDQPNPRGVYAGSKLLGDWFALEHPRAYVLRVESLFGEPRSGRSRRGSLGTILDQIKAGVKVPVFVDRTVSPSYTADVARATRELIERRAAPGLYHCVNSGSATWAEIAEEVAGRLGVPALLQQITLEDAGLRAPRPKYCALSNAKLKAAGISMPPWQDALARFLASLDYRFTPEREWQAP